MESGVKAPAPKVFYFGFAGSGHFLYDSNGDKCGGEVENPWGKYLDGVLCPDGAALKMEALMQPQGKALLHHKDGWTAIGFWDRSGDTRFNSNTAFLVRGTYTFDEILALAKGQFPGVFARMGFPIVEISDAETLGQEASAS